MKIYIDNEEVLCASKMNIKESLKNTNSVILNNVYPKSWESDKDYISRFYMPKDYSKCLVKGDEQPKVEKDHTDKIDIIPRRHIENGEGTFHPLVVDENGKLVAIPVIPGETYKIKLTSSNGPNNIYESVSYNSLNAVFLQTLEDGESEITITPTRAYILANYQENDTYYVEIESVTETTNYNEIDLSENIYTLNGRYIAYSNSTIYYSATQQIQYVPVIPGEYYYVKLKNTYAISGRNICQTDSLNIGTACSSIIFIFSGEPTIIVKPTKKYLVLSATGGIDGNVTIEKVKILSKEDLIFSGFIKNSGNINLNPRYPHYATLQLLDYKSFLSEGDTLNYVIDNKSVLETLQYIVKDLKGFALGEINIEDTLITKYNCDNKTPYDAFEYLAEITGSVWYTKAVNENLVLINFYSTDKLEQKDNIEYTPEYFVENSIQDIQYSYNAKDYRNKQVILSDNAKAEITQTEYITYIGSNIRTTYPIANIESVTSGTNNYSITTNVGKSIGIYANIYYTYGNNEIEVNNISIGKTLKITYYPVVNSRQVAYNQDEIDRISDTTNRNGIIARYEKRGDTTDEKALAQISQTYLDYKGVPEVKLKVKTYYKDIFKIGDVVFFNGPLENLKTRYLVINKELEMYTAGDQQKIFYTYELSSSFNDENAINFFDNQRRKLSGNIEEGEYISRYIDLPSQTDIIFYDLSVAETMTPGDILDGELDIELLGNSNILNGTLNLVL